jgi:hypothetical protein
MPNSYKYFKKEIKEYFKENIPSTKRILDVGPGEGTYSNLLRELGYKMDCVEIHSPYISTYNLKDKYDKVFLGDIVSQDISNYDFIILGDVLEHISEVDAKNLITKIVNQGKECLVSIPYLMPQDGIDDNDYEKHLQEDLTPCGIGPADLAVVPHRGGIRLTVHGGGQALQRTASHDPRHRERGPGRYRADASHRET